MEVVFDSVGASWSLFFGLLSRICRWSTGAPRHGGPLAEGAPGPSFLDLRAPVAVEHAEVDSKLVHGLRQEPGQSSVNSQPKRSSRTRSK